jgi:head-tail adaptor
VRAGKLDKRIAIQRKSITQSPSGQPVETWATVATRWAYVVPASAGERFSTPQLAAKQQTEFGIRWSQDIADLTPLDRLVYPIPSGSPPPPVPSTSIYGVLEVHEVGRHEGFRIIAVRRVDT